MQGVFHRLLARRTIYRASDEIADPRHVAGQRCIRVKDAAERRGRHSVFIQTVLAINEGVDFIVEGVAKRLQHSAGRGLRGADL